MIGWFLKSKVFLQQLQNSEHRTQSLWARCAAPSLLPVRSNSKKFGCMNLEELPASYIAAFHHPNYTFSGLGSGNVGIDWDKNNWFGEKDTDSCNLYNCFLSMDCC